MSDGNVVDAEAVIGEEDMQRQAPEEQLQVESAFTVVLDENGHWIASTSLLNKPIQIARVPTVHDMYHAVAVIERDISSATVVDQFMQIQQQVAKKTLQDAENKRIADEVLSKRSGGAVDLSKLKG